MSASLPWTWGMFCTGYQETAHQMAHTLLCNMPCKFILSKCTINKLCVNVSLKSSLFSDQAFQCYEFQFLFCPLRGPVSFTAMETPGRSQKGNGSTGEQWTSAPILYGLGAIWVLRRGMRKKDTMPEFAHWEDNHLQNGLRQTKDLIQSQRVSKTYRLE